MRRKTAATLFAFAPLFLLVFALTGCESVKVYSLNSYQGLLPLTDMRVLSETEQMP